MATLKVDTITSADTPTVSITDGASISGVTTFSSDINIADKIVHTGDTNTAIRFPAADTITAETGGTEAFRVDSSQRLLIGGTSSLSQYGSNSYLQVQGTGFDDSTIALRRDQANANPPGVVFAKSRSGSLGGNTIVQDGDRIGTLIYAAADGTDLTSIAAEIKVEIDGTPGSNDTPGRIVFQTTADGASSSTERLRISSDGSSVFEVAATEVDIKGTGSGDRFPLRLFNSDTTSTNMTGIYFGPCNNVAGAYVAGKAEADFTSTANRDAGLEFGTRLDGNWKEAMRISAAGYVTKPLHPILQRGNSTAKDGNLIEYEYAVIDQGSNWDSTNHRFTAPVAGIYFVGLYGMSATSQGTMDIQVNKNGSDYNAIVPYSAMSAHQYHHFCGLGTIQLAVNDYVSVNISTGDMYYNSNGRHGGLTIFLIG